jgi:alkanesulfonate monooxygenase SsuD/methylene tetrahydromethanopterin reductase-like flavin-dependent oxidoreductase (luciferase family)
MASAVGLGDLLGRPATLDPAGAPPSLQYPEVVGMRDVDAGPAPGGRPGVPLGLIEFLDTARNGPAATAARRRTCLRGALAADRLGYRRVWVPEHHGRGSASTNPLPLMAALGAMTTRIRVGAAVSLVRVRDPYLTAEDLVTAGLFCGDRLDVGLGRGDVAGPAAEALAALRKDDAATRAAMDTIMSALDGGCSWIDPLGVPYQRWLHGAGTASAERAGELGFDYCHGLFLNPDRGACADALARHRAGNPGGRRAVAVALVANDDGDRARADAALQRGLRLLAAGPVAECAAALSDLRAATGVEEVVVAELSRAPGDHLAALAGLAGSTGAGPIASRPAAAVSR